MAERRRQNPDHQTFTFLYPDLSSVLSQPGVLEAKKHIWLWRLARVVALCVCLSVVYVTGRRSAYQVEPAVRLLEVDKDQLSGQGGDLPLPPYGEGATRPQPLAPEVRLVWFG